MEDPPPPIEVLEGPPAPGEELPPLPYVGAEFMADDAPDPVGVGLDPVAELDPPVDPKDSLELPVVDDDVEPEPVPELEAVLPPLEVGDGPDEPLEDDPPVGPEDSPELGPEADDVEPEPVPEAGLEPEAGDEEEPVSAEVG